MPLNTPNKKVDNVRRYGAEAILFGDTLRRSGSRSIAPRFRGWYLGFAL